MTMYFQRLWNICSASKKMLQLSVPRERGLPLEPSKMGSKRRKFSPLPLALRKKKANFIGRHGEGAENARKYREIDVTSKTP